MDKYAIFFFGTYFIFLIYLNIQMRKSLSKKLKSNEGASLMVALLFFVVCAAIGSIILTAATATSGRMKGVKTDNQSYYALMSAAKVFEDEWSTGGVTLYRENGKVMTIDSTNHLRTDSWYDPDFVSSRDMLASSVYRNGETAPESQSYVMSIPAISDLSEVKADVTMDKNYDISVVISTLNSDGTTNSDSCINLLYKATITPLSEGNNKKQVNWANPLLSVGGNLK